MSAQGLFVEPEQPCRLARADRHAFGEGREQRGGDGSGGRHRSRLRKGEMLDAVEQATGGALADAD